MMSFFVVEEQFSKNIDRLTHLWNFLTLWCVDL